MKYCNEHVRGEQNLLFIFQMMAKSWFSYVKLKGNHHFVVPTIFPSAPIALFLYIYIWVTWVCLNVLVLVDSSGHY